MIRHGGLHFFSLYRKYVIKVKDWEIKVRQEKANVLEKTQVIHWRLQQKPEPLSEKRKNQRQRLIEDFYKIKPPFPLKQIAQLLKRSTSPGSFLR